METLSVSNTSMQISLSLSMIRVNVKLVNHCSTRDGEVITPELSSDILKGITRNIILQIQGSI